MALKFNSLAQIEKDYFFIDAVTDTDVLNGTFGDIEGGKFVAGANKTKAIMQVEVGDDMYCDEYKITAGSHVRVVDLARVAAQCHNKCFEVYGVQVPTGVKVADKLVSDATGKLIVNTSVDSGATYFAVKELIGNKSGIKVEICTEG